MQANSAHGELPPTGGDAISLIGMIAAGAGAVYVFYFLLG